MMVWGEFSYQGTSGCRSSTIVNDRVTLLGTPAAQATGMGTGSWTGESGTAWSGKLAPASSITPAEIGELRARVCVGLASATVYVDRRSGLANDGPRPSHTGRAVRSRSPALRAMRRVGWSLSRQRGVGSASGVLAVTLAAVSVSASGALTVSGSASSTLAAVGISASGAVAVAGSSAVALADVGLSGSGAVGSSPSGGALSVALSACSQPPPVR